MNKEIGKSSGIIRSLMEAVVIGVVASGVAIAVSFVHPKSIPLVANAAYETMVPCPVHGGKVAVADPSALFEENVFIVDARYEDEFDAWHVKGAVRLTYDYLDPIPEEELQRLTKEIAAARAVKVVVYGDGAVPDTGELLGKEISGHGIKNVFYVKGGADALQKAGGNQ